MTVKFGPKMTDMNGVHERGALTLDLRNGIAGAFRGSLHRSDTWKWPSLTDFSGRYEIRGTVIAPLVIKQAVTTCVFISVDQGGTDHE
jgi:hypothetical protein